MYKTASVMIYNGCGRCRPMHSRGLSGEGEQYVRNHFTDAKLENCDRGRYAGGKTIMFDVPSYRLTFTYLYVFFYLYNNKSISYLLGLVVIVCGWKLLLEI